MNQNSSKTALKETLEMLEYMAAYRADQNKQEEKRQVNVRIPEADFQLLEQLAEHFDESRTSLAQHLLEAAIRDASSALGIRLNTDELRAKAAVL